MFHPVALCTPDVLEGVYALVVWHIGVLCSMDDQAGCLDIAERKSSHRSGLCSVVVGPRYSLTVGEGGGKHCFKEGAYRRRRHDVGAALCYLLAGKATGFAQCPSTIDLSEISAVSFTSFWPIVFMKVARMDGPEAFPGFWLLTPPMDTRPQTFSG